MLAVIKTWRFIQTYIKHWRTVKMKECYTVYIFSKILLSKVNFSSWLASLWSPNIFFWGKYDVTWNCVQAVTLTSFLGWNSDWAIIWDRIRISVSCTLSFNIPSDVHSCLFCAETGIKVRRRSVHMLFALPLLLNWGAKATCQSTLNHAKTAFIVLIL